MSGEGESPYCAAITNTGDQCSRLAKDGQFCFQHDASYETINRELNTEKSGYLTVVSDTVGEKTVSFSDARRDVSKNFKELFGEVDGLSEAIRSADVGKAAEKFKDVVGSSAPTAGKGALLGGVAGSPFGPIGVAAGVTLGSWFGVYRTIGDDRMVAATIVDEAPDDAEVISLETDSIRDLEPVQLAVQSAKEETSRREWIKSTLFRERDMDEVEEALQPLPKYDGREDYNGYFVKDESSGEVFLLIFGIPQE